MPLLGSPRGDLHEFAGLVPAEHTGKPALRTRRGQPSTGIGSQQPAPVRPRGECPRRRRAPGQRGTAASLLVLLGEPGPQHADVERFEPAATVGGLGLLAALVVRRHAVEERQQRHDVPEVRPHGVLGQTTFIAQVILVVAHDLSRVLREGGT